MGFNRFIDMASSYEEGRMWLSFIHKTGTPILPASGGWWGDMSMAAGTPKYNAYVGTQLEGTPLVGSGNNGIYAGENVSPLAKYLNRIYVKTNNATFAPAIMVLCDYKYFYPLVDADSTDLQEMINTTPAPRIPTSARDDIQIMLVTSVPQTGNANCTIIYTNQSGVPDRTSTFVVRGPSNVGNCNCFGSAGVVGSANPFIPLQSGDWGVKSVQSIQFDASAGGFVNVVLVEPLATVLIRETNTVCEHFFGKHKPSLPLIRDGAYLGFLFSSGLAATSSIIRGELEIYWN